MISSDIASVSASVPFSRIATPEDILDGILRPADRLDMVPYVSRLIFEIPPSIFLEFCLRKNLTAEAVKNVYDWHRERSGGAAAPRVRAIEEFYHGLA